MPRPSSRDRVLDALEDVLLETGPDAATLAGVAARAGISKGGLLYHFPSKNALLAGLVERWAQRAEEELDAALATGSSVAEYWLTTAGVPGDPRRDAALVRSLAALMRSGAQGPLAVLIADVTRRWQERLRKEIQDPVLAETVRLVGDGVYLAHLTGAPAPDPQLLAAVRERLLAEALGRRTMTKER